MQVEFPKQTNEKASKESLIAKLYQYRRPIMGLLLVLALIATIVLQMTWKKSGKVKDFFHVNHYLSSLDRGGVLDEDQIRKYLSQFPELHPFFDHHLMQHFILDHQVSEADKMCQTILKRISFIDPKLLEFTKGTLEIEKGNYQIAKELSENLLQTLEKEEFAVEDSYLKQFVKKRIDALTKALAVVD